jgi:hypothetical protein
MTWRGGLKLVRKLAKRLRKMLLVSKIFAEHFKPPKMP